MVGLGTSLRDISLEASLDMLLCLHPPSDRENQVWNPSKGTLCCHVMRLVRYTHTWCTFGIGLFNHGVIFDFSISCGVFAFFFGSCSCALLIVLYATAVAVPVYVPSKCDS